ncbi:MAG: type II secretion system protein GspK [Rhodanobacter sp.]
MMMQATPGARGMQRGVALLLVLWASTLLAILLGGFAMLARTEGLQARYQFAHTQAHYAAEAGLMRAVYGLQDPLPRQRWIGDGRTYTFDFEGATVQVAAVDEGGKLDINAATPEVLRNFFGAAGMAPQAAQQLEERILDWRRPLGFSTEAGSGGDAYAAAGLPYGPRRAPFASIEELQMVLGMTPALYRRVAPEVTIWSGNPAPDPNTAPPLALQSIPGMTPAQIQALREARLKNAGDPSLVLNNGTTHSIESAATLADGTRAVLRATIRMHAEQPGTQPYAVLRWQEGAGE